MRNLILSILLLFMLTNCSSDNNINTKNPYLPDYSVNLVLNLNLPAYVNLQYPSNAVYVNQAGAGIRGIIVFNAGSYYKAFDAACPNQALSNCSTMTINGIKAKCPCDDKEYSLFTGLGDAEYPMKEYRVEATGNQLRIYN